MGRRFVLLAAALPLLLAHSSAPAADPAALGLFERQADIGDVGLAGGLEFDSQAQTYRLTGGGANMWGAADALHFVWKEWDGDLLFTADVAWLGAGKDPHRKACLIVRRGLEPGAAYADVALHGDGLTSLQYRETPGGPTREVQANIRGPRRLRLEKRGDYVTMSLAGPDEEFRSVGGMFRIDLGKRFLVGLGVCAHDNSVSETAVFSKVSLAAPPPSSGRTVLESTLERIDIASTDRRVVHHERAHFEAPNWSRDGQHLLYNQDGHLKRIPAAGGKPAPIETGFARRINNDHGYSPDGKLLAISDQTRPGGSRIYILPSGGGGGTPRLATPLAPSYWHGWSPDGKTLAYCAERDGEFDLYTIPVDGGSERRLTRSPGLDDGPDYAPDGRHIYFNSVRSGRMKIWRITADGGEPTQLTSDGYNDWFPHPSPDGRWLAFVSYGPEVEGHPANEDVLLRIMPAAGGEARVLAKLFGGQGTMNVPSWSPDSRHLAFVSYQLVDAADDKTKAGKPEADKAGAGP